MCRAGPGAPATSRIPEQSTVSVRRCHRSSRLTLRTTGRSMAAAHPPTELTPETLEEPIRAELFGVERLEQHAESLAAAQQVLGGSVRGRPLLPRVQDNGRVLRETYRAVAAAIREERSIVPAAEWLVDNFHIVD